MNQSPFEIAFERWRERCRVWMRSERGRMSALAKHLGIRRQVVWRWFNCYWSKMPGWAGVACNCWYYQNISKDEDQALRAAQKEKQLGNPILVHRSKDNVSPQADKFVPRSGDNYHSHFEEELEEEAF